MILTVWLLLGGTEVGVLDENALDAPMVPEGLLFKAMYPKRPADCEPHCSNGYPGQS